LAAPRPISVNNSGYKGIKDLTLKGEKPARGISLLSGPRMTRGGDRFRAVGGLKVALARGAIRLTRIFESWYSGN
jgi:hypothetical protein